MMYLGWKKKLADAYETVPLEIPGRGRAADVPCPDTVEEIAELLAGEIRSKAEGRAYALFGYCYGGIVAYEICRVLHQKGFPMPEDVFVCGAVPPSGAREIKPLLKQKEKRAELRSMLSRFFPPYLTSDKEALDRICVRYMEELFEKYDQAGKITAVLPEDLASPGGTADHKLLQYILDFANSFFVNYGKDEASLLRYCGGQREPFSLDCGLSVICGRDDSLTGRSGGAWQQCSVRPIDLIYIDGDHFSLIEDIDVIAAIIKKEKGDSISSGLRDIWRRVLSADESLVIDDEADFFEAGGNSLLLGMLNILIEKELGKKLNVETLFRNQTFGAMAAAVREA